MMEENVKPNSHLLLKIGNEQVDIRLIETAGSMLLKKILLPEELEVINKMCIRLKYTFRQFLIKHNSDIQEIYKDGDIDKMTIPVHNLSKFQDITAELEELEKDEELLDQLISILPKVAMAIFIYMEQQEERDLAVGVGRFLKRTVRDFSDRFMEEPPHIVNDILSRIDKRIESILEENDRLKSKINGENRIKESSVFICYSSADIDFVEGLKKHFVSIKSYVDVWGEHNIKPGELIEESTTGAISTSKILLLMLSVDFFNSDIYKSELFLKTLSEAHENGVIILPVILRPILLEEYPEIEKYKTINLTEDPISGMSESNKEKVWVEIVRRVKDIIKKN